MHSYPERVRNNILPLSVASTLPKAFEEWSFTDHVIDHEPASATCQLCEHEELRYHFEIRNALTGHCLWVGSQCILKFGVSVFEQGQRLSASDSKKKLDRLLAQMRLDSCISSLEKLAASEQHEILTNALSYYKKNKYLTPKFAFVVLWRLQRHHIDHSPSFFKIRLKTERQKEDLRDMHPDRLRVIWSALTPAQRRLAVELGHSAPQ